MFAVFVDLVVYLVLVYVEDEILINDEIVADVGKLGFGDVAKFDEDKILLLAVGEFNGNVLFNDNDDSKLIGNHNVSMRGKIPMNHELISSTRIHLINLLLDIEDNKSIYETHNQTSK